MNSADLAGAHWFKSSRSNGDRECVEVAFLDGGTVGLRDSKDRGTGAAVVVGAREWEAFLDGVVAGEIIRSR